MSMARSAFAMALCIAPSAAFNIWPKVATIIAGATVADHATVAMLVFQTAAVIVMAWCPVAVSRAPDWPARIAGLVLFSVLALINFTNALEVASHSQDAKTALARGTMNGSAALERELAELSNSRTRLPQFVPATPAMATAAQEAVTAAQKSRAEECKKRGPLCREREGDERKARETLAEIEGRRALTQRAEKLDGEIDQARAKLFDIGAAPKYEDGTAYRIGRMLGVPEEAVLDWRPIALAAAIELLAALGPLVLIGTWRKTGRKQPINSQSAANADAPLKTTVAAVEKTTVLPTLATAAKSRKSKPSKAAAVTAVDQWLGERTIPRPGNDVPCGEAYSDYAAFSRDRCETPMSLTAFGIAMRGIAGIDKITTPSKRNFYRGIALSGKPTLVVISRK